MHIDLFLDLIIEFFEREFALEISIDQLEVVVEDNLLILFDNVELMHNVFHRDYLEIFQMLNVDDHSKKKTTKKISNEMKRKTRLVLVMKVNEVFFSNMLKVVDDIVVE